MWASETGFPTVVGTPCDDAIEGDQVSTGNNPYKGQVESWAYTDKGSGQQSKDWEARERWPECRVCGVPMGRGYVYINSEGTQVENKFGDENFRGIRCLKRRLNGLPDDEERAMAALLARVESAELDAKRKKELNDAHVANLVHIRAALKAVLETAPGLAKGVVAPPGGLLARQVSMLQSSVDKVVTLSRI